MSPRDPNSVPVSRLVWTAGVVLGASLPHWFELPLWIPALLASCVVWRFASKLLHWPLPPTWLKLAMAFIAFSCVLLEYRTINGLTAGSALLVVMVALKFLESRTQRDHLVLMMIAYFLVFANLLTEGGIVKGLYLLAFVWITTVGLLQLGRHGLLLPTWPTAKLAARLLLQSVPIMLVLFVLFPRLPGPLWAMPGESSLARSGLSGEMSPGDITDLALSDEVAFRVEFEDAPPNAADLYWRGPVLTRFNGVTWRQPEGMGRRVEDTIEYLGGPSQYRVVLEPNGQRWAFALDMPESWAASGRFESLRMGSDYQLRLFAPDRPGRRLEYSVTSYTRYAAREPLTELQREILTRLPESGSPRTRELVASWLGTELAPTEVIERALDVFRDAQFFYTLTPAALSGDHLDAFLFDTREGFCEHYASAFTIMMRLAGIPARVVTGYQGGELNAYGDYYVIRQSSAHAWTEVWLEDEGWVRIDPIAIVAPERLALGFSGSSIGSEATVGANLRRFAITRQLLLAWDALNTFWNQRIIGFGPAMQRAMLRWLGFERPRWDDLLLLAAVTTAVLLALLSLWLTLGFRRERHDDPAARWYGAFVRTLKHRDVAPIGVGETATDYAARARQRIPEEARAIDEITRAYLAARYEPDATGAALEKLKARVRDFSRGYVPAWR